MKKASHSHFTSQGGKPKASPSPIHCLIHQGVLQSFVYLKGAGNGHVSDGGETLNHTKTTQKRRPIRGGAVRMTNENLAFQTGVEDYLEYNSTARISFTSMGSSSRKGSRISFALNCSLFFSM